MKKMFILAVVALSFVSCTKNGEQIEAAKKKLNEIGMTYVNDLTFQADEVSAVDVYNKVAKMETQAAKELDEVGEYAAAGKSLQEAGKYVALGAKNKGKKGYIVKGYQLAAGDTLHKIFVYLDDTNNVIRFNNLK